MRFTFALTLTALSLAACSSAPVPTDAGADTSTDAPRDVGTVDGTMTPDAPDAGPCGGRCGPDTRCDNGACVPADAGSTEAATVIDAPTADQVDASDASRDVDALDALDGGPLDTGTATDTGALTDTGPDVPAGFLACAVDGGVNVVNAQRDPENCGACGVRCCGLWCISGVCGTEGPPGTTACPLSPEDQAARGCTGPVPVNTATDPANCGGCGIACGAGGVCSGGVCVMPDAGADVVAVDRPDVSTVDASTSDAGCVTTCEGVCLDLSGACTSGYGACAAHGEYVCGRDAGAAIGMGNGFSFAILTDGSARAWGPNDVGRLGDGTTETRPLPTTVFGDGRLVQIGGGMFHACGLYEDGSVRCWGTNAYWEIGVGAPRVSPAPVHVEGVDNAVRLSVGQRYACAALRGGTVRCWGYNVQGQLGDGTSLERREPVDVVGIHDAIDVSASYGGFTCVLRSDRTVWCWGTNVYGELGDGTITGRRTPAPVTGLTQVRQVAAGTTHTCALKLDGTVYCWGENYRHQLGNGTSVNSRVPVPVVGLTSVVQIVVGHEHGCALNADGTVHCWGQNASGEIGDGMVGFRATPSRVVGLDHVTAIASRGSTNCALRDDRTVWCWGWHYGALGNGRTNEYSLVPVQVLSLTDGRQCSVAVSPPAIETCNRVDDDCDGVLDNVLGATCP